MDGQNCCHAVLLTGFLCLVKGRDRLVVAVVTNTILDHTVQDGKAESVRRLVEDGVKSCSAGNCFIFTKEMIGLQFLF